MRGFISVFSCFVWIVLCSLFYGHKAFADESTSLLTVGQGQLPLILSAPHGGQLAIPGVQARKGDGVNRFVTRSDMNTLTLGIRLADAIERKTGKGPFTVFARTHRKYLDFNRRAEDAFESPKAVPLYDAYHKAIDDAGEKIVDRWGHGLLLDLHGQSSQPGAILRGTQNGKTTTHLVNRFGSEALRGKTSLFGRLAERGIAVVPLVGSTDDEASGYTGGHIVGNHGSKNGGTIDAIQLELGYDFRRKAALDATVEKLADAIILFSADYLPKRPVKTFRDSSADCPH